MKTTQYLEFRRRLPGRIEIQDAWIERVMATPAWKEMQSDGRMKMWARIAEAGGRYLRVIVLQDGETVHNAFFDRGFRMESP